jgi:hypothetical protein
MMLFDDLPYYKSEEQIVNQDELIEYLKKQVEKKMN